MDRSSDGCLRYVAMFGYYHGPIFGHVFTRRKNMASIMLNVVSDRPDKLKIHLFLDFI